MRLGVEGGGWRQRDPSACHGRWTAGVLCGERSIVQRARIIILKIYVELLAWGRRGQNNLRVEYFIGEKYIQLYLNSSEQIYQMLDTKGRSRSDDMLATSRDGSEKY